MMGTEMALQRLLGGGGITGGGTAGGMLGSARAALNGSSAAGFAAPIAAALSTAVAAAVSTQTARDISEFGFMGGSRRGSYNDRVGSLLASGFVADQSRVQHGGSSNR